MPKLGDSLPREERELTGAVDEFMLKRGSLLYMPRGYVHAAEATEGCSLHMTLGMGVITWADVLASAVAQMIEEDDGLKESLPPNFLSADRKSLDDFLDGFFKQAAKKYPLDHFAERFMDEILGRFPLDMTGGLESVIGLDAGSLKERYVLADGLAARIKTSAEGVTVALPGKEVSLPPATEAAVRRLFSGAPVSSGELPGLDEEEGEVLIRRFVREGVLRRCGDKG